MEPYGICTFVNVGGELGDTQWILIRLHKGLLGNYLWNYVKVPWGNISNTTQDDYPLGYIGGDSNIIYGIHDMIINRP